jgi:putative endonuclease
MKEYYVYIMASSSLVLYTGVTNDIVRRVGEHRYKCIPGFTTRYKVDKLLYFESMNDINLAIAREKQIKAWRREKKFALILSTNPKLTDLSARWFGQARD